MRRRELVLLLATNMMAARAVRAQQKAMPVIGFLGIWHPLAASQGHGIWGFRDEFARDCHAPWLRGSGCATRSILAGPFHHHLPSFTELY